MQLVWPKERTVLPSKGSRGATQWPAWDCKSLCYTIEEPACVWGSRLHTWARSLLLEQPDWDGLFIKSAGSSIGIKSLGSGG